MNINCKILLFIRIPNNEIMNTIGSRVKYLIENRGITAYEVSHATGISESTISRITHKSSKPNIKNCKLLADYFGVSKEWILVGSNENLNDYRITDPHVKKHEESEPEEDPYTLSLIELLFKSELFKKKIIEIVKEENKEGPFKNLTNEDGLKILDNIEKMIQSKSITK